MKFISRTNQSVICLFLSVIASLLLTLSGCGDSSPSAAEVTTGQLQANNWRISSVIVDGMDKTNVYDGLTLSFTSNTYTTTNGEPVWPANGTWMFTDESALKIRRDDNVEVTIVEISGDVLKLSLNWATGTLGQGRTKSVAGNHVFSFVK